MHRLSGLLTVSLCIVGLTLGGCDRGQNAQTAPAPEATVTPDDGTDATSPAETNSTPSTTAPSPEPTAATPPSPSNPAPTGTALTPPKSAQLIAQQPEAKINLRSQPSANSSAKGYGLVGDPIQLLRSTEGDDGYPWYYVRFEESGAEGWIRSDFVNIAGRAQALPTNISQSRACKGLMEVLAFEAYYTGNTFQMIRFTNLESKSTFDSSLRQVATNDQGQPVYTGQVSPPTGGSYAVQLTDLSGGSPGSGTQVAINYSDFLSGTGTCN